MNLYPAIDLKDGKCIRLTKGKLEKITFYNSNPLDQAKEFINLGAKYIHMVDIDGAFKGKNCNHEIFIKIKKETKCFIQVGGGIRNEGTVAYLIDNNIDRIVLGTIAVTNPKLVKEISLKFPGKIAIGLDAKKGFVTTEGWSKTKKITVTELAKKYEDMGINHIIFTDIEKDGVLEGLSFDQLQDLLESTSINVIASGGVASLEDIKKLKQISLNNPNLVGVIVGKAIYENKLQVDHAVNFLNGKNEN
jgi:phosphoribosylformimino-5-aminoimidazole carboxamide ribotide isomerase